MAMELYSKPIRVESAVSFVKEMSSGPLSGVVLVVTIKTGIPGVALNHNTQGEELSEWELGDEFVRRCNALSVPVSTSFTFAVHNQKDSNGRPIVGPSITCVTEGGVTSTITFTNPPQLGDCHDDVIIALGRHFDIRSKGELLREAIPDEVRGVIEQRERNVDDLEHSLRQLQKVTAAVLEEQATRALNFQESLASQADKQRAALDEEYTQRRKSLDEEREAFEELRRNLDDRDSREVRRELKDQMLEAISERGGVSVSDSVYNTRKLIHLVCWFAMFVGLALMALACVHYIGIDKTDSGFALDMPSLQLFTPGAILFGSTLIFYLRWSDRWFRDHADIEFSNHQFEHDVLRASWVAEFVVEASKDGREVPEHLLDRISLNLFQNQTNPSEHHPTDDVNKLLRKVTKLRIGKGAFEIEKPPDTLKK